MKISKFIYFSLLLISLVFSYSYYQARTIEAEENHNTLIYSHIERIRHVISSTIKSIDFFAEAMHAHKDTLSKEEFDYFASALYDPQLFVGITYDPNGRVTYAYPYEQNKNVIGLNLLDSPLTKKESIKAKNEKRTILCGPYSLLQGGNGLVFRYPIFMKSSTEGSRDEFWGFITVIIRTPNFLYSTGLLSLEKLGYEYSVQGQYKNLPVTMMESVGFNENGAVYTDFKVNNNTWRISLYSVSDHINITQHTALIFFLLLVIATLIYKALEQLEKRSFIHSQLLSVDKLTGAYNRMFLDSYNFSAGYTVFYIDLDKFKPINDTYGHNVGDQILKIYVERLKRQLKENTPVVRMGGDEFVIIIDKVLTEDEIQGLKSRIYHAAKEAFYINQHQIEISSCIGHGFCPMDGHDFKQVLEVADQRMYNEKFIKKKAII